MVAVGVVVTSSSGSGRVGVGSLAAHQDWSGVECWEEEEAEEEEEEEVVDSGMREEERELGIVLV